MMDKVSILKEVKPLLEKLKRIQTDETVSIVQEWGDKFEKKQTEIQLKTDQMKLEIHRLSSL